MQQAAMHSAAAKNGTSGESPSDRGDQLGSAPATPMASPGSVASGVNLQPAAETLLCYNCDEAPQDGDFVYVGGTKNRKVKCGPCNRASGKMQYHGVSCKSFSGLSALEKKRFWTAAKTKFDVKALIAHCEETVKKSGYVAHKSGTQGQWRPEKYWTSLGFSEADLNKAPQKPANPGEEGGTILYKMLSLIHI